MWLLVIAILVLSYLVGSIPAGYLVARWKGIDIRQHGSGNIGATNVFRVIGKPYGIGVFVFDALKGLLPVLGAVCAANHYGGEAAPLIATSVAGILAALGCILGHNYTCWLGFKGGKGIATSAGALLGLIPMAIGIALIIWILLFFTTRYVAVASMAAALTLPVVVAVQGQLAGAYDLPMLGFTIVVAFLAILRHRSNIQRLLAGTEHKMVGKKNKDQQPS